MRPLRAFARSKKKEIVMTDLPDSSSRSLTLPDDPQAALARLLEASKEEPVLVFKKSPICPVSFAAEDRVQAFVSASATAFRYVEIDVIAQKPLARGLTAALNIRHESPQGLVFREGACAWHDSHDALTGEALALALES